MPPRRNPRGWSHSPLNQEGIGCMTDPPPPRRPLPPSNQTGPSHTGRAFRVAVRAGSPEHRARHQTGPGHPRPEPGTQASRLNPRPFLQSDRAFSSCGSVPNWRVVFPLLTLSRQTTVMGEHQPYATFHPRGGAVQVKGSLSPPPPLGPPPSSLFLPPFSPPALPLSGGQAGAEKVPPAGRASVASTACCQFTAAEPTRPSHGHLAGGPGSPDNGALLAQRSQRVNWAGTVTPAALAALPRALVPWSSAPNPGA